MGLNSITPTVQTTDATVTLASLDNIPVNTVTTVELYVEGTSTTGDLITMKKLLVIRRLGSAVPTITSQIDLFSTVKTLGALLWDVVFTADTYGFRVSVKGAAGTTINWYTESYGLTIQMP